MTTRAATFEAIPAGFDWFAQQMIDRDKVEAIRLHLRAGGKTPPVVMARYGDRLMPIDGHHRTAAHDLEHLPMEAWVISGRTFEWLDRTQNDRAENCITCNGVPALAFADAWNLENA